MDYTDSAIEEAVLKAQELARKEGLRVGQTVASPADELTYCLMAIEGDTAVVGLRAEESPTKQAIEKRFPLAELFDPNVSYNFIMQSYTSPA
jgi:hypothetical protein